MKAKENFKILNSEYGAFRREISKYFKRVVLKEPSVFLDPMAGTAPLIPFVEANGHTAYFNDIMPIHFFINKAKTYSVYNNYRRRGHDWHFEQLIKCMLPLEGKVLCISDKWIDDDILARLTQAWQEVETYDEDSAALLRAVILLCVRPFSSTTKSKNPTWLKSGGISSGKDVRNIIRESLNKFDEYYRYHYGSLEISKRGKCILSKQDASELRLPEKVDYVLTSPPYCNRLDPMALYGPENYFLSMLNGVSPEQGLVSSPKVRKYGEFEHDFEILTEKSKYARTLLVELKKSKKKDDPSYYLKYYTRYFGNLYRVMNNVLECVSETGKIYIVTQDNTHRGRLVKIDRVLRELLGAKGWQSRVLIKWARHHMGLRNVSRDHPIARPKQLEKLVELWR